MIDAPLMLSVSGARGIVGQTMTPDFVQRFVAAFVAHLQDRLERMPRRLVIARDGRPSGTELVRAVVERLVALGVEPCVLGVATTPTAGVMIDHLDADGGIVITASHNPSQWNGIKCLTSDGAAPARDDADDIIARLERNEAPPDASTPGEIHNVATPHDEHIGRVLAQVDVVAIERASMTVLLDSVNGAGCEAGRRLLEALGTTVLHINGEPNGEFPRNPEPTQANLVETAEHTRAAGAAAGFAQDPDADRLAIIDETGTYIGEEYTLVLATKRMLDRCAGEQPITLATNLSTSRMIDDLAARYDNVRVLRSAVGEANVVATMREAGALIGGEGNGGVILPAVTWVRDSLSSMALTLDLLAADGRSLSEIVADLPHYTMIKRKVDLNEIGGRAAIASALERARTSFPNARINDSDGVRLDFEDGWVHLRPSNTEPIMRIIAEARDEARASQLVEEVRAAAL